MERQAKDGERSRQRERKRRDRVEGRSSEGNPGENDSRSAPPGADVARRGKPEREHESDPGQQRERVPVPDRGAEAREPAVVGGEGSEHLRQERPAERRPQEPE